MGVGNNTNESRDNKIHSMDRQQANASRNHFELSETAEIPTISQPLLLSQTSNDTKPTASVSCNNSPFHVNENESFQSSNVIAKDDSNTSTATTTISSTTGEQQSKVQIARRERRPDRAVYVPRARRSQTTPPTTAATAATTTTMTTTTNTATVATNITTTSSFSSSSNHQKSNSIANETVSGTSLVKTDESTKKKAKTISSNNITTLASKNGIVNCKERRVERQRKSLDKTKSTNTQKELIKESKQQVCDRQQLNQSIVCEEEEEEAIASNDNNTSTKEKRLAANSVESKAARIAVTANEMNTTKNKSLKRVPSLSAAAAENGVADALLETKIALPSVPKVSHMLIEEVASNASNLRAVNPTKCDIDAQELQRASKEINRSNRRIMKQTFVSDVLEIPDRIEHTSNVHTYSITNAKARSPPFTNFDSTTEDEEDDWESKYNETGDCLDPKILEELESALGKVKITTPKTDYSAFLTNQAILNDEEFPHVLEVSNFPVEFKNQDLLMVFSQYKESGFDIKWVDDTHALAVFSSSRIAAEVLTMGHPFVVLKPLAEATLESRLKAKKCAGSLQPYRQRPETCAALARRLVTGALGVRLETAAAERENEKRVLRKAKERKLLAAKQRDEAWES